MLSFFSVCLREVEEAKEGSCCIKGSNDPLGIHRAGTVILLQTRLAKEREPVVKSRPNTRYPDLGN
jgi:hypothetical protein